MTRNISMIAAIRANMKQNTSKDIFAQTTLGPHLCQRVCVPSQRTVQILQRNPKVPATPNFYSFVYQILCRPVK